MKRKINILIHSIILIFILALFVGNSAVRAEDEVKINYTKYTVNIGDEDNGLQLKMENLGDKKPRWVSYNVNVATVDQYGYVTPLRKGTAIISSGIGFPRKTCVVTVVDPSVELNKSTATIYRSDNDNTSGNKVTLTAKVSGATRNAADIVWSSSNEEVAKVVKDARGRGVVTSVTEAGEAVITARVNGRTASCKVEVLDIDLELNVKEMYLSTRGAGSAIRLVPTVVGPKRSVTWTSSDRKIATVSGGKVTGKKEGTVIVTAKANGVEKHCTVHVEPGRISINTESELLYVTKNDFKGTVGESKELKTNMTNGEKIAWSSDNENVVTVDSKNRGKAKITAVGVGKAVITAKCDGKTDTCMVEVKEPTTSIEEEDVYLKTRGAARSYTLDYHVAGRNKAVWTSSDTKVVSVSRGKLVGKKAGSATVTVKANGVEDTVRVTVTDTPTISLNQKEYTLYTKGKGNTVTLKATVDGANKKVTWSSDAPQIAEVNKSGKITAKSAGSALITATANGVTAKCLVNVKEPKIILDKNELIIKPNAKANLCEETSMEIIGESQAVTYKSSDVKTATVDKKGVVTAKKAGRATITIKANGVESKCYVTVSECETHNWVPAEDDASSRPATCEESGLANEVCTECEGRQQTVTNPLGHDFGSWTVVSKATATEVGLEQQVCTRCNEVNTRTIPATNKGELAYGYKLMWEDDFNGEALDRSSWNVELHEPGWVNAELQQYEDDSKNIYVKDGNLVIQAIKDGNSYTSGRINTQNKHDYTYGRFEARAKVPSGKGFLPAFWMMPTDESYYGQWPKCGEIDIMEVMGQETNKVYSTLHFGEPHDESQGTLTLEEGDFSEEFHVYACEWEPGEIRFYVDGNLIHKENDWFTQKPGFGEAAYPAPFDQPFYMILNVAVGGSWVGYPDETTMFGDNAQLVVDYVRVYQKDPAAYDIDVEKPEKAEETFREPDENGNYIINGDFAKVEDMVSGDWQLLTAEGGEATAEIKENELQITTTKAGSVDYSVQIVQAGVPVRKGNQYKLSFDAYADEARTMITDISAPFHGWARYLPDTTVNLTTEWQPYEYTFDMTSDDDGRARLEFNLGNQGSTAKVHISNVKLVKTDVEVEVPEVNVLPDGNYVYNGFFEEGNEAGKLRLAYWDWDIDKCRGASVSVTSDAKRELKVVVPQTVQKPEDVVVYQKSIAITGGKMYKLSFDAYADRAKTIQTTIAGKTFTSNLTTDKQTFSYDLDLTEEDLNGSELRFLLGTAGTTYIDNVSIREDGLIVNGDFSNGMVGYEVFVDSSASAPYYVVDSLNEDNAFSIDIEDTGDQDWKIQLKQSNIKLEKDKWYKIGFDAKSTMDREIMYALQRDGSKHNDDWTPYSGTQHINLNGGWQPFSHTFKMTEDTDSETILSISMGAVSEKQITTKHTVLIDNITLEETDPVEIAPVEEGKEMIANGDFSEGDKYWKDETGGGVADVSFTDGKASYKITNVGSNDWDVKLSHTEKLTLEAGTSYKVKFNIKSTAARTVKYSFMTSDYKWYGGEDLKLQANEAKEVEYEMTVGYQESGEPWPTSNDITFSISMGKIAGEETPASTIEIDDISVKKIGGTGGDTEEDPIVPLAPGTELIKNGDFANGKEDWTQSGPCEGGEAEFNVTDEKAVFDITNVGNETYSVQLKQSGLQLEQGASYKVKFKIQSDVARKVSYMLQEDESWAVYDSDDLELTANTELPVERTIMVDKATSNKIMFVIAMGKIGDTPISESHKIEIDEVSVVKDSDADEKPEEDPVEIGTDLIKNGKFAGGQADWSDYFHEEDGTAGNATFTDGKARYEITNAGTANWNVQLKQTGLTMEKGASYKVNFKIASTIDRTVEFAFQDADDGWYGGTSIDLTANKQKSVSRVITLQDKEVNGLLRFQLSMGQIGDTTLEAHAIEISDVSVTKVTDGTAPDEEKDEEVEIEPLATSEPESDAKSDPDTTATPPANNSDDNASDDSGKATEVQDDQNIENPDDLSDDTADDEGAEEDTSDSQNDSGAEETPDDQSDSGSQNESGIAEDGEVEP
ncbi:MAG: family 16 glycosylhydrolase [Lachnospiraceae bacterium]|nr:family 16 glycosylhydrolase [Lachnospiraceae bacterium]